MVRLQKTTRVLSNVMLYLVTDTAGTGVWYYRGSADDVLPAGSGSRGKIMVPTGYMAFPHEMVNLAPPKSALERDFNLVRYTKMPHGRHFGCFEQPKLFYGAEVSSCRGVRGSGTAVDQTICVPRMVAPGRYCRRWPTWSWVRYSPRCNASSPRFTVSTTRVSSSKYRVTIS